MRISTHLTVAILMCSMGLSFSCTDFPTDGEQNGELTEQILFNSNRTAEGDPGDIEKLEIFRMNPDGSGITQVTQRRSENESHFVPSVSPDGSQIAFVVSQRYENQENVNHIYTANIDGTEMTQVTPDSMSWNINPTWAPDTNRIAYASRYNDTRNIYTIGADGTDLKQITQSATNEYGPAWSPDGSSIAFNSDRDGDYDIYIRNLEQQQVTQITDTDGTDQFPRFSPNGEQILFNSPRDGDFEIYIANRDGSELRQITDNTVRDISLSWAPDGSAISFTTTRDGNREIYKRDIVFEDSEAVNLTNRPNAADWDSHWNMVDIPNE